MNKKIQNCFLSLLGYLLIYISCQIKAEGATKVEESGPDKFISERVLPKPSISKTELVEQVTSTYPSSYLTNSLNPWNVGDPEELIEFAFEDAELSNFIKYIEERFGITFITDNDLDPLPAGGASVLNRKDII